MHFSPNMVNTLEEVSMDNLFSEKEQSWIKQITNHTRALTKNDTTGHDYWHHLRVRNLCRIISSKEGGNKLILEASALLHDVYRGQEKIGKGLHFGHEALSNITSFLSEIYFPTNYIEKVIECIKFHEDYDFLNEAKKLPLEVIILQDADRTDALGAIGIARTFIFTGAHNLPLWNPSENREIFDPTKGPKKSGITHFYEKLLRLEKTMHTKTGQHIAKERSRYMRIFLDKFFEEWNSKDTTIHIDFKNQNES